MNIQHMKEWLPAILPGWQLDHEGDHHVAYKSEVDGPDRFLRVKYETLGGADRYDQIFVSFYDISLVPIYAIHVRGVHAAAQQWREIGSSVFIIGSLEDWISRQASHLEDLHNLSTTTSFSRYLTARLIATARSSEFDTLFRQVMGNSGLWRDPNSRSNCELQVIGAIAMQHGYSQEYISRVLANLEVGIAVAEMLI